MLTSTEQISHAKHVFMSASTGFLGSSIVRRTELVGAHLGTESIIGANFDYADLTGATIGGSSAGITTLERMMF